MFLRYIVSTKGIIIDPSKVSTIQEQSTPIFKRSIQEFLGFTNYNRRFIKGYSVITKPLIDLTKDIVEFVQIDKAAEAFKQLKLAFLTEPILLIFNLEKEGRVETDVLDFTIRVVLSQQGKSSKQ